MSFKGTATRTFCFPSHAFPKRKIAVGLGSTTGTRSEVAAVQDATPQDLKLRPNSPEVSRTVGHLLRIAPRAEPSQSVETLASDSPQKFQTGKTSGKPFRRRRRGYFFFFSSTAGATPESLNWFTKYLSTELRLAPPTIVLTSS